MAITTFRILDLECLSCAMEMEGICEDTAGVTKAEVKAVKQILVVEHDENLNVSEIKQALDKEGYSVEQVAQ